MPGNAELEAWKQATWDYLLEHCDIERSGTLFIKFHTDGRWNFERRIQARANGYHREDPRDKEEQHIVNKVTHKAEKRKKKELWKASKEERIKVFEKLKRQNKRKALFHKFTLGIFQSKNTTP